MKILMVVIMENDKYLFQNRAAGRGTFLQNNLIINETLEITS